MVLAMQRVYVLSRLRDWSRGNRRATGQTLEGIPFMSRIILASHELHYTPVSQLEAGSTHRRPSVAFTPVGVLLVYGNDGMGVLLSFSRFFA